MSENEPGEWLPCEMFKLQEDGREGGGGEEEGGEVGKVSYNLGTTDKVTTLLQSWAKDKTARKAALRKLKDQLKKGTDYNLLIQPLKYKTIYSLSSRKSIFNL